MELIRGLYNLHEQHRGCAVTIGNFDGVHTGHQHLINTVCEQAKEASLRACVVSFEPLPVEFFLPREKHPHRLTGPREKISRLAAQPLDQMLLLRFNQALAHCTAEQFIEHVLINGLDTRYLLIGDDFRFGKDRKGTFATLQAASKQHGFTLQQATTLSHNGERVSSTRVRKLLSDGNLHQAAKLLGRDYSIEGRVEYGAQLGRTIGFPTANIALKNHNPPLRGVFAVELSGHLDPQSGDTGTDRTTMDSTSSGDQVLRGIANVGVKPTVKGVRLSLEVHALDFDGELYRKRLRVTFLHKLRDEKKFSGLDELKAAIALDEQNARQWFAQQ